MPPLQPLKEHSQGQPNGYLDHSMQSHTLDTSGNKQEPLHSRGPTSGRKCCVTPAFSGVFKTGDKIRSGYLTPTFLGAHKWAEVLRNPCVLGGPQKRGQNQKWLPHPCLLGVPHSMEA